MRSDMDIAIVCFSLTGHTLEMAGEIAAGIRESGAEAKIYNIHSEQADKDYLEAASGLIIGSPTYLAASVWQTGKLGGAFATAHYAQGGQDTAIMDIMGQLLVKGMLIYSGGGSYGLPIIHHGPVALDKEGNHYDESREMFRIYGRRFASKALELFG